MNTKDEEQYESAAAVKPTMIVRRSQPGQQQENNAKNLADARRAKYKKPHPRNYTGKERHYAGRLGYA